MSKFRNPHAGLEALLTPQDSVLLLIDHQAFQFANLHSHEVRQSPSHRRSRRPLRPSLWNSAVAPSFSLRRFA